MRTYIVRWCDYEGICYERRFGSLYDAKAEARYLNQHYDGVEVVTPSGKRLWPMEWDGYAGGPAERRKS